MNIVYRYIYPTLGLVVAVLILVLGFIVVRDLVTDDSKDEKFSTTEQDTTPADSESTETSYTLAEVAKGNTRTNCILAYDGNVFLVPDSYFEEHPAGAEPIINNCGNDVTEAFNNIHNPTGTAFSDLQVFKVGVLETDGYTMSKVEEANSIDNCLIVYKDSVYAIPSTFPQEHPGGSENIIESCGKDVTSAFDNAHDGSQEAFDQLEEFIVGTLEN